MLIETATWRADRGWSPALQELDELADLLIVFGDTEAGSHRDAPLAAVAHTWPDAAAIGCSTAGQVLGKELLDGAVVVAAIRFATTKVVAAHVDVELSGGPRRAGRRLAEQLATPGLTGAFVVSGGRGVNGTALAAGFADILPELELSGGLAGDGDRFGDPWTFVDGEPRFGWASAIGFVGDDIEIGHGIGGGWDIFGPERVVTRSFGNVLYELDGRPVLGLYEEYLGTAATELPASGMFFPLEVRDLDGRAMVRTVLSVNPADGSMTFAGDIAQGATAQLMRASTDNLVHGAHLAAKEAALGGSEEIAIAVSCVGRRMVLGERTDEELEAAADAFTHGMPMVGFYAYGELSPSDGTSDLHNQTMTITTLRERRTDGTAS